MIASFDCYTNLALDGAGFKEIQPQINHPSTIDFNSHLPVGISALANLYLEQIPFRNCLGSKF